MRHTIHVLGSSESSKHLKLVEPDHGTYHAMTAARVQAARLGGGIDYTLSRAQQAAEARKRAIKHGIRTIVLLTIGIAVGATLMALAGCGSSVEATAEERIAPPVQCGSPSQPCPRVG